MVRKIIALLFCVAIVGATCATSHANAYSIYSDGNISNTYVTYFSDIVSGLPFSHNYVAFRSGQNEYIMITGKLEFSNNRFTAVDTDLTEYKFYTSGNMNNQQYYSVMSIDSFSLDYNSRIIYSDLGNFPQLVSRGEKYEILNTFLLVLLLLSFVVWNLFRRC